MADKALDKGMIPFQTEGRLLQELGERLVASPQVALVELVKNCYDADAATCTVALTEDEGFITVQDDGLGMTYEQFATRWMRIATSNKVGSPISPRFKRNLTGQKGIGRFAVRFLGRSLELKSVAYDPKRKCKTRLVAKFDWLKLDQQTNLVDATVPWEVFKANDKEPLGTTLTISKLRVDPSFAKSTEFRTLVLKITSPLRALDGGRFRQLQQDARKDPGFEVFLPETNDDQEPELDIAAAVISHAWAQLVVDLEGDQLTYTVKFHDEQKPIKFKTKVKSVIKNGLHADIRYFPKRAGVFRDIEVNGQVAWSWVRENHGVAVIDNGFRIIPYGMSDNDWLHLDTDRAHSEREWRSNVSLEHFPIPKEMRAPADNPMIILATNYQLVGGVFVRSAGIGAHGDDDLITSMDRQGFLYNDAFEQLVDIVRGGIEFLAREDRDWMLREADIRAKAAARRTRADFKAAVKYIEDSDTLTRADKARLVESYTDLAQKITEVEDYDREARRKVETMSALGVVAGFMTHEAARVVASLKDVISELERIARKHPSVRKSVENIQEGYNALTGQLEYTKTFIDATQRDQRAKFKVAAQLNHVVETFGDFARHRNIAIEIDVDPKLESPVLPIAAYSGIMLNLYTNALKAIMAASSSKSGSKIRFTASNDDRWHTVEVLDTGIGIPPDLRKRVFDPLFTTTSRLNNPLGSGMGLGLTLVKQLVEQLDGRIELTDAPDGFSTRFRIQFPRHG